MIKKEISMFLNSILSFKKMYGYYPYVSPVEVVPLLENILAYLEEEEKDTQAS